jgi:hypothetical protein
MNTQKQSEQWAWWSEIKQQHIYVFPSKMQVEMCSPDSFKSAIEKGEGEIVQVIISSIKQEVKNEI